MSQRDYISPGPSDRIAGHPHETGSQTPDQRVAQGYQYDDLYERLLTMPDADREAMLTRLGSTKRIGYGHYRETREAAKRVGKPVGKAATA